MAAHGLLYVFDDTGTAYPCVATLDSLPDIDVTGLTNGMTLVWNSSTAKWEVGTAGTGITVSATPPDNPAVGDLWVDIS